jgi:hypothetical protein
MRCAAGVPEPNQGTGLKKKWTEIELDLFRRLLHKSPAPNPFLTLKKIKESLPAPVIRAGLI